MSASIFIDKNRQSTKQMLAKVLGETHQLWEEIEKHLNSVYGEIIQEWTFY